MAPDRARACRRLLAALALIVLAVALASAALLRRHGLRPSLDLAVPGGEPRRFELLYSKRTNAFHDVTVAGVVGCAGQVVCIGISSPWGRAWVPLGRVFAVLPPVVGDADQRFWTSINVGDFAGLRGPPLCGVR